LRSVDEIAPSSTYVALHVDRLDGTDLLTVRQRLGSVGNLQVYAGAGLARAKYLDDDPLAKPLPWRRAHHALGAAAEVGARTQIGNQVSLEAAVRWMKLGSDVTLLQSDTGSFSAHPLMLGVTVGYRFR
jgi:outer membrane protein W